MAQPMSAATPTFAVVGAVNHGKSSVVATLAENDQVVVSSMPGETAACQVFSLRDLFVFIDTPGFQNPFEALEELRAAASVREPIQVFRDFVARHRNKESFDAECRLFEPVIQGAGLVYVVDGSERLRPEHEAEMEILRLTARPRLAIINRTGEDNHVAEWKERLSQHFSAVREFNAHKANFADRVELLETLAGIEQAWKPKLAEAVRILREDWEARRTDSAEIIVEMLCDCLTMRISEPPRSELPSERARQAEALRERFTKDLSRREARAHEAIIGLFGHNLVKTGSPEMPEIGGLFGEETWKLLGLNEGQLIAAAAAVGAAVGAGVDLLTAGHTLLMGTAIGGALGGAAAWLVGKQRPEVKVRLPGLLGRLHLAGSEMTAGPLKAVDFPWILLDRAQGVFAYVVNRSHARRDRAVLDARQLMAMLERENMATSVWPDAVRKACTQQLAAIWAGKLTPERRAALRELICGRLEQANARRLDIPA